MMIVQKNLISQIVKAASSSWIATQIVNKKKVPFTLILINILEFFFFKIVNVINHETNKIKKSFF